MDATTTTATTPEPAASVADQARRIAADHRLYRLMEQVEASRTLDPVIDALAPVARAAVGRGAARALLGGRWLGHALHPLMTDVPVGTWMSASLLDLVGGRGTEDAARRLVGIGVAAALPTAVTGLSDWTTTERPEQRAGLVHAAANGAALACYSASWRARRRGDQRRGVALGLVGVAAAGVGGYVGGHLAMARGTGVDATREMFPPSSDG